MLDSVQVSQATNVAAQQATGLVAGLACVGVFDTPQAALAAWEGAFAFMQPIILVAHEQNQNVNKTQQTFAAQGIEATIVAEAPTSPVEAPTAPQGNVVPFQSTQPAQAPTAPDASNYQGF